MYAFSLPAGAVNVVDTMVPQYVPPPHEPLVPNTNCTTSPIDFSSPYIALRLPKLQYTSLGAW